VSRDRLRLGTRQSPLALAQSGMMARALEALHPGLAVELVRITTRGDRLRGSLTHLGGKGLFTQELEEGLLRGDLDLAVHSLKDLPVRLPEGLRVVAFPARADARDVLVSELASDLAGLPAGGVVLTGSLRRQAQVLHLRPDLRVVAIRGNVDTRLRRWREEGAAGVILAAAGLERLGLASRGDLPAHPLDPGLVVPAPGQGALAIEARAGSTAEVYCRALDHPPTARAVAAERAVVAAFGGDCTLPLAAWARPADGDLRLTALLASPDGRRLARGETTGERPEEIARRCVAAVRAAGADAILDELRSGFS
jgi:hydroxymethylbilane synthase